MHDVRFAREGRPPAVAHRLEQRSWWGGKRRGKGFQNDNLTDWALSPTYLRPMLAIFPALLALVSVLRLIATGRRSR